MVTGVNPLKVTGVSPLKLKVTASRKEPFMWGWGWGEAGIVAMGQLILTFEPSGNPLPLYWGCDQPD